MIVFCHLFNDRSGSPKVLSSTIYALCSSGRKARLFLGSDGDGFLDDIDIPTSKYWYRRGPHRLITLFTYFFSQLCLFFHLLMARDIPRDAIVYVNTLLPFGAALFGLVTRRKVIYHLHEVSVSPSSLRAFLIGVARLTAKQLIYVSDFHRQCLPVEGVPARTIYNVLDHEFVSKAGSSPYRPRNDGAFQVLMLASLRDYKGIPEYIDLANRFISDSNIAFHLVVNDDLGAIKKYFSDRFKPTNLVIYPRTDNPCTFYETASLVVNLSRPDLWLETFGLTLLEAMTYGIPVVAPNVGGPLELVTESKEGFLVDSRNGDLLEKRVRQLLNDEALCLKFSQAARAKAALFSPESYFQDLINVLVKQGS